MSFPEESQKPDAPDPLPEPVDEAPEGQVPTQGEQISFPEESPLPEGFTPIEEAGRLPRARRRRASRMLVPPGADNRAILLDSLAQRAIPSFDFFLLALLCGIVLGAAYLLDSPAVLLLGVLAAPLLTPWVGLALATKVGSWRFFFLTLGAMLVACGLVFVGGMLTGMAGRLWLPRPFFYANIHSHLWWLDLFVVALGAALLIITFVHSEQKPILPSVMLAYGLFLPLSAAGLGFGTHTARIWPDGLLVFIVHLTLAMLVGAFVLAILRFKPVKAGGYLLSIVITLACLAAFFTFTGATAMIRDRIMATARWMATPTPTTLALPSITPTGSPGTATRSPTAGPTATLQPTGTLQPTPAYAMITSPELGGANIRTEPGGGTLITTLMNGNLVQVLPEIEAAGGATWVRVRLADGTEGWVLQTVLTATALTPTATFTPTLTPIP